MARRTPPPPVEPSTTDDLDAVLTDEPWLAAFVEVGDVDLEPARLRFQIAQLDARRQLRQAGVAVAVRARHHGLLTTSYDRATVIDDEDEPT